MHTLAAGSLLAMAVNLSTHADDLTDESACASLQPRQVMFACPDAAEILEDDLVFRRCRTDMVEANGLSPWRSLLHWTPSPRGS